MLVRPGWHDELWGIRLAAAILLVVLAGSGLFSRQWKLVLAAGLTSLTGRVLWMLLLSANHTPSELPPPQRTESPTC